MGDIKQVIVMRTDLNMRKGKMVAQGAHASIAFLTSKISIDDKSMNLTSRGERWRTSLYLTSAERLWVKGLFTKICVGVGSQEELESVHAEALKVGLNSILITDSGLTEFHGAPTKTCLAIGPDESERIDSITGHLKLL